MQWLFTFFTVGSFFFACICGKMQPLCQAALQSCSDGVTLCLTLLGSMGFWSGIMKIAEQSGLTQKITQLFMHPIQWLFSNLKDKQALQLICMNITANLLGLGNAATPLGIQTMKRLDELNGYTAEPSFHMILFVCINTASLQLIPTTTAFLRSNYGSTQPFSILPATFCTSACALIAVIITVKLCYHKKRTS